MPELPEVETVRSGLAQAMVGSVIADVDLRRPNLRFDFPDRFAERLLGTTVQSLDRRGKYLLASLSSDEVLIMHLGMSGRFSLLDGGKVHEGSASPGVFTFNTATLPTHDHVVFYLETRARHKGKQAKAKKAKRVQVIYNDPRRFGYMDLIARDQLEDCRHFKGMGPEPLGNGFSQAVLAQNLKGRRAPIKQALLDQRVVAGLGNIYVCEALFRAGISPRRLAMNVPASRLGPLYREIVAVLREAIEAGGSSLKDFAGSDGAPGYFQHAFQVYDREGAPCHHCGKTVKRLVQSGRSTFFCSHCQR